MCKRKQILFLPYRATGPAMTWSMHSIGWIEIGDVEQAEENFNRGYQTYVREPFKVWTEAIFGTGAINFITGMGGFLQNILMGYMGIRIGLEELLIMNPVLLPGTTGLSVKG
ncbi:unnamed protein product [Cyprideis torosa]|uniref:Uncharacterized protein n=1 Tax=Cyprideis torosa TaxID=163714 RepID=A0A7R8ZZI1_9CRUS|nr:unnamed protein product [Cyprideis torosa]CAG0909662.1 unnamed protein product [Cyprideis torosa]